MSRTLALARLRALHDAWPPPVHAFCERVRHVVLIGCSSRGGSSVFTEMLRHHSGITHLPAEINPLLAMAGCAFPESGTGSDALDVRHLNASVRDRLSLAFAHQAGGPGHEVDPEHMARQLLWRLTAQWPEVEFDADAVASCVRAAQDKPGDVFHLIKRVHDVYPQVNPWFSDLDSKRLKQVFPALPTPLGAPSSTVIEEPPFVLTQPWLPVSEADLARRPFVFKTPSNAYRLPFLRALFPNARVQLLHLARNPAAAINGLVDGWRFRGFHAHPMDTPLEIEGYTEHNWWKYDLPSGWREWTQRSLVEVAGFQWSAAHRAIMDHAHKDPIDTFRLRFEDVVGPAAVRHERIGALLDWMGVSANSRFSQVVAEGLPPIMATARPRQRRWFKRAALIEPVLAAEHVANTAMALGYTDRSEWT